MFAEHLRINHRPIDMTRLDLTQQTPNPVDDLIPSAVTERKDKREPGIPSRAFD